MSRRLLAGLACVLSASLLLACGERGSAPNAVAGAGPTGGQSGSAGHTSAAGSDGSSSSAGNQTGGIAGLAGSSGGPGAGAGGDGPTAGPPNVILLVADDPLP